VISKIETLLEKRFQEEAYKGCFLVDIVHKNQKLQVFIDHDEGISYKMCTSFSRYLEEYLDESKIMGDKYILEVSSPGADRPIKLKRQLPKNIGRKVKYLLNSGDHKKQVGKLIGVEDNIIIVEIKEKKKDAVQHRIDFDQLAELKVVISF